MNSKYYKWTSIWLRLEQWTNRDDLTSHGIYTDRTDTIEACACYVLRSGQNPFLLHVNTVQKGACSHDSFTFKECSDYQTALVTVTGTIVTNWIGCIAKFWFSIHGSLQDCVYTSKNNNNNNNNNNKKKKKQQLTSNMYKHKFIVYVVNQLSTTTMCIQLYWELFPVLYVTCSYGSLSISSYWASGSCCGLVVTTFP